MACKKTDIFLNIEKKLFDEYPELKSKKLFYIANGNVIDKYISLEQNKIKNGNSILINESNEWLNIINIIVILNENKY